MKKKIAVITAVLLVAVTALFSIGIPLRLYVRVKGVDTESDKYNPMSYHFIAGELALHMMLADATDMLGANSWNSLLKDIYDRAALVNLNVDENRIPQPLMVLLGKIITFLFDFFVD